MNSKNELIKLLNDAFEMEYNEVFLYSREAEIFKKKIVGGEKLAEVFNNFSITELHHSDRLASEILRLGEKPVWKFKEFATEASVHKMLNKHIESEMQAYNHYKRILEFKLSPDFEIIVSGIMNNEKFHLEKLIDIYKKLDRSKGTNL